MEDLKNELSKGLTYTSLLNGNTQSLCSEIQSNTLFTIYTQIASSQLSSTSSKKSQEAIKYIKEALIILSSDLSKLFNSQLSYR